MAASKESGKIKIRTISQPFDPENPCSCRIASSRAPAPSAVPPISTVTTATVGGATYSPTELIDPEIRRLRCDPGDEGLEHYF